MAFPEGNKLFAGDLRANLDETNAGMVQFTRDGSGNGLSSTKHAFAESLQLQMSVLHQSICIFKALKSSLFDCWVPGVSDPNQNVKTTSLHNLKIYSLKGCRKTSQKCKTSQRCRWIYLANTAILNIRIFSWRFHFRLWVFTSTGEYFYCWHWRVLHDVLQSKYDANTFNNFVYILFYALTSQIIICIVYCRLVRLTNWGL